MNKQDQSAFPFDTLRFPFLGTRREGEPFEYLLMEINYEKANIAIFKWMVNRTILNYDEKIDLFLPLRLTAEYDFRRNISGKITSIKEDTIAQEYLYEVSFEQPLSTLFSDNGTFEQFTQKLIADTELTHLLFRLLKDSLILKQSLLVYLKHFVPYFSRIINYPTEDYRKFKELVFDDVINRIKNNENLLDELYFSLRENVKTIPDISIYLNLEELREIIESEISLDLFLIAFTAQASGTDLLNLLSKPEEYTQNYRDYHYVNYLFVIKNLEKRLYSNYNQIVLIYIKSI